MSTSVHLVNHKKHLREAIHLFTQEIPVKIRLDVFSESDFDVFLEDLKRLSGLQLTVKKTQTGCQKFNWGRDYKCKHSTGNIRCPVCWTVRIKKITRGTIQKDKLVKDYPCIVTIDGIHTHALDLPTVVHYQIMEKNGVDLWAEMFSRMDSNMHIRLDVHSREEFLPLLKQIKVIAKVNYVTKPATFDKTLYKWSQRYVCHHGGRSKSKNLSCQVVMDVKIIDLELDSGMDTLSEKYPCLLDISGCHSHEIMCVESLRMLPISSPTKNTLKESFKNGFGPSRAMYALSKNLSVEQRADASNNPNMRSLYYWNKKYQIEQFGDLGGTKMFEAILNLSKTSNAKIKFQNKTDCDEMVISILTPLSERVLAQVPQCSEILFMDTTSHLDLMNTSATLILTWSPVGGLPVGFILTDSQTEEAYAQGLKQWLSLLPTNPFFGQAAPRIIMTDDSDAEGNAISRVFPDSRRLLCQFHLLQAMWRWLWDGHHEILNSDRKSLMLQFKALVYAESESKFQMEFQKLKLQITAQKYPNYIRHVTDVCKKKHSWALCYRQFLPTGGHHTNNFCEATMRILKEVILDRGKVYNTAELVEVLATQFDSYFQDRILNVALMKTKALHNPPVPNKSISQDMIIEDEDGLFFVKSGQSDENYLVDSKVKVCSCPYGRTGKLCKHLLAVEAHYPHVVTIPKIVTRSDRYNLALLAVGKENSPKPAFFGIQEPSVQEFQCRLVASESSISSTLMKAETEMDKVDVQNTQSLIHSMCENLKQALTKFIDDPTVLKGILSMNSTMMKIKTANGLASSLHLFGKEAVGSASSRRRSRKIQVQPTGIARREIGKPRGSTALRKGRPTLQGSITKRLSKPKRPHNLLQCVLKNSQNGKKHGTAH